MAMNLGSQLGSHEGVRNQHGSAEGTDPPVVAPSATNHGTGVSCAPLTSAMKGAPRRAHGPAQRRGADRATTSSPTMRRHTSRSPRPTLEFDASSDMPAVMPVLGTPGCNSLGGASSHWHHGKPGPGRSLEDTPWHCIRSIGNTHQTSRGRARSD